MSERTNLRVFWIRKASDKSDLPSVTSPDPSPSLRPQWSSLASHGEDSLLGLGTWRQRAQLEVAQGLSAIQRGPGGVVARLPLSPGAILSGQQSPGVLDPLPLGGGGWGVEGAR